jgi:hypothetical protein
MNARGEHEFRNYLGISLWISSMELSPDRITQIVGIEPSYVRVRGALIPGRGMSRRPEFDVHEWQFREQLNLSSGDYVGDHSEKFITEFLDKIKDAAPRVKELSGGHSVTISLTYHTHEIPYIGLTREHVQAIAALGARLDYDVMVERHNPAETGDHVSPLEKE